jgi:hypothetical protein
MDNKPRLKNNFHKKTLLENEAAQQELLPENNTDRIKASQIDVENT